MWKEKVKERNKGIHQRIMGGRKGWSSGTSFILPRHENSYEITATFTFHLSFFPLFFLSPYTLLLFPEAIRYPSPDFGIKVLPSSSTSNLFSSLFFHYTSLLPL